MGAHCHTVQSIGDDNIIHGKLRITGGHILVQSEENTETLEEQNGFQIRTSPGVEHTLNIDWNTCHKR